MKNKKLIVLCTLFALHVSHMSAFLQSAIQSTSNLLQHYTKVRTINVLSSAIGTTYIALFSRIYTCFTSDNANQTEQQESLQDGADRGYSKKITKLATDCLAIGLMRATGSFLQKKNLVPKILKNVDLVEAGIYGPMGMATKFAINKLKSRSPETVNTLDVLGTSTELPALLLPYLQGIHHLPQFHFRKPY